MKKPMVKKTAKKGKEKDFKKKDKVSFMDMIKKNKKNK